MSFRQKHLWISLIAGVGVWGFYFWRLISRVAGGGLGEAGFVRDTSLLFVACLVLVVLIEVVLTVVATLTTPKRRRSTRDDREIDAAFKASHVALMGLIGLVCCVAVGIWLIGLVGGDWLARRAAVVPERNSLMVLANILVACLVLAEMIRAGTTLVLLKTRG